MCVCVGGTLVCACVVGGTRVCGQGGGGHLGHNPEGSGLPKDSQQGW